MYQYAGVVVNNDSVQVDKVFTYKIPIRLIGSVHLGFRVKVPFGRGNRTVDAFVLELYKQCENVKNIKEITTICDEMPLLKITDIELVKIMKKKYLCTYLECIKVIIPRGITKGIKNKTMQVLTASKELEGKFLNEPYKNIYEIIQLNNMKYNKTEFSKNFNKSLSSINTMIKHGFLTTQEVIINRYSEKNYSRYEEKTLNERQQQSVDFIINSKAKKFLIHGVTGSGKTEIYMNLVSYMLKENKQSIILIPEISLTPQMVERFKGRFGRDIAVFHSRLSDGERYDEWMRVKLGNVKIAIGARSAIFLPFENLGLIVIDEEHEASYKSDSNPKFDAREIAYMKCELENCKLILGSATPSIESYYRSTIKELELITINERADGAAMPKVEIVDMREELMNNNRSIFSKPLHEGIIESLSRNEQVILFLNRRGFSTFVSCRKCGYVFKCKKCDISLTYHNSSEYLTCHYCGEKEKISKTCPNCGSSYVKYFGVGTEKIEQEINRIFPSAKTLRMDFDTTRKKNSYEYIYNTFKNKQADILIGTQMVAKGLDFKNVTLVGVIAADLSLNLPDFRAFERTFQLLTQVSGRAGRGKKEGKVVIQTYNADNLTIQYAAENDYDSFYKNEIMMRKVMDYPPFTSILVITMSSEDENLLIKSTQNVGENLKYKIKNNDKITLLGPCPCGVSKIKNFYRWQIIIKGNIEQTIAEEIKKSVYELLKNVYTSIRVSIDINPSNMI
ncbi:primosomal protein N' [Clostridium sp. CM028]|uniref:primosomal protein N' n=1 Tax=unclassified Clostridium TaxID=2614128 RepID=UPI001C0E0BA2|nr:MULTISPECIES: primosomal protein N' [unclassified Clostridium]MBU3091593.1 primosomal protein N' [Clostridium sp. CF011]MBW9144142.1 primosomal protein N' [Clostridium sp. CM027]MBW9147547.1 primosomal protein N' [Clostridium sp. CM028]UVE41215.1 primosomal protein N' [Clostridium sp. CM027]WAG70211.1 primosomal protein N' [Clostridium sp. CF011]